MIKRIDQTTRTHSTTPSKEASRSDKQSGMRATAEEVKKLAQRLPFGAGRHTFSEKPSDLSVAKRMTKLVKNLI
jgi:hypothetical protein